MGVEDQGYTLKEVIEKNFTDLRADMKTGFSETRVDVKEIRVTAEAALTSTKSAHKRLDNYDKHIFVIWGALVAGAAKILFDQFGG